MGWRARLGALATVVVLVAGAEPAVGAAPRPSLALPVRATLVAPAAHATAVPTTAQLRVPLDTGDGRWPEVSAQFAEGSFGVRISSPGGPVEWYVGPGVSPRPGLQTGPASFDPTSATVTVSPSLPAGAAITVTLAIEQSLQTLLTTDTSAGHPLALPASSTSFSWSFTTSAAASLSSQVAVARPGSPATATAPLAGGGTVSVTASGAGTVTLTTYGGAPVAASGLAPATSFFDVEVQPGSTLDTVTVSSCGSSRAPGLSWYSTSGWQMVAPANSTVTCVSATLGQATWPSISLLTGTAFAATPPPVVSALNPGSGPTAGGTSVTVTGSGFTGATGVAFGPASGSGLIVTSDASLTIISPPGSGTVDLTVSTPGGTSAVTTSDHYVYVPLTTPVQSSIGVPAYFPPGPGWSQLSAAHPPVSVAIVNPASGPGVAADSAYLTQIATTQTAGVPVLGYVGTSYGNVPLATVESEISEYLSWYHVNGIFLDEVSTSCTLANGTGSYYSDLASWIRSQPGSPSITLNPGTQTNLCYLSVGDVIVNFEGDAATYIGSYSAPGWVASQPASRFWHIVYGVGTPSAAANIAALATSRNAATVYATDVSLSAGPFSRLPSAPWWTAEVQAAAHAPHIRAVTPDTASFTGGDTITVLGAGFTGASSVAMGSQSILDFKVVSDSMIVFRCPGGPIGTVDVQVAGPGGTSAVGPQDRVSFFSGSPLAATPEGATGPGGVTRYATSPGPREVTSGPDANLWLTEGDANQIVRVVPTTGARTVFPLPHPDSGLSGITTGPDGNLWFAERWHSSIGRITPAGVITEFPIAPQANPAYTGSTSPGTGTGTSTVGSGGSGGSSPPATIPAAPDGIVSGPGGKLWFTDPATNRIGVASVSGVVSEPYVAPTPSSGSGPIRLAVGGDGNVWFTEYSVSRIGVVNAATDTVSDFPTPDAGGLPMGITSAPDGSLWVAESGPQRLVHLAAGTPLVTLADLHTSGAPTEVVIGPDGNLWYSDYIGMHRMTPDGAELDFPSPAIEPVGLGITVGPDQRIWMAEYDGNSLDVKSPAVANVVTAGAKGTGTVDDGPAFKTALSQLAGLGGGTLLVPPGTYAVDPSDFVSVPSNVTMMGTGAGATIEAFAWGYALLGASGSHLALSGLTLNGSGMVVRGIEIDQGATDVYLGHLDVGHVAQPPTSNAADAANTYQVPAAIRINGGGDRIMIDADTIHDVVATNYDSTWPSPTARGIWITQTSTGGPVSHHVTIQGSSVSDVTPKDDGDCVVIQGTATDAGEEAFFVARNDSFTSCAKRAIKVQVPGASVYADTIDNPYTGNNSTLVPTPNNYDMFSAVSVLGGDAAVTGVTASGTGSFYKGIDIDAAPGVALADIALDHDSVTMGPNASIAYSSSVAETAPVSGLLIASATLNTATNGIRVDEMAVPLTLPCATNTFTNIAHPYSFGAPYLAWPC